MPEIGFEVAKLFLEDSVPDEVLKEMIDEVLNFDIPVVPVHHNIYSLELFHLHWHLKMLVQDLWRDLCPIMRMETL